MISIPKEASKGQRMLDIKGSLWRSCVFEGGCVKRESSRRGQNQEINLVFGDLSYDLHTHTLTPRNPTRRTVKCGSYTLILFLHVSKDGSACV